MASALSFTAGGILPLLTIVLLPSSLKVPLTFVIVLVALALTGTLAARAGGAHPLRPTVRVVIGGALAMIITYSIGHMFHISGV